MEPDILDTVSSRDVADWAMERKTQAQEAQRRKEGGEERFMRTLSGRVWEGTLGTKKQER